MQDMIFEFVGKIVAMVTTFYAIQMEIKYAEVQMYNMCFLVCRTRHCHGNQIVLQNPCGGDYFYTFLLVLMKQTNDDLEVYIYM